MSEFGLTRQLGFSREESRGYIAKYFQRYPGVLDYMERTRQIAREQGLSKPFWVVACIRPILWQAIK